MASEEPSIWVKPYYYVRSWFVIPPDELEESRQIISLQVKQLADAIKHYENREKEISDEIDKIKQEIAILAKNPSSRNRAKTKISVLVLKEITHKRISGNLLKYIKAESLLRSIWDDIVTTYELKDFVKTAKKLRPDKISKKAEEVSESTIDLGDMLSDFDASIREMGQELMNINTTTEEILGEDDYEELMNKISKEYAPDAQTITKHTAKPSLESSTIKDSSVLTNLPNTVDSHPIHITHDKKVLEELSMAT